jgi:ribosome-associated protein
MLSKKIAELILAKKGYDVVVMDLRSLTSVTDFFVVCSADSDVQIKAIAGGVEDGLEAKGVTPWKKEYGSTNWVLLDYVDVVLHIFHKNTRSFYNLEKLWGDAEIRHVKDALKPTLKRSPRKLHVRKKPVSRKTAVS